MAQIERMRDMHEVLSLNRASVVIYEIRVTVDTPACLYCKELATILYSRLSL
jgi:hypothetical protein